MKKQRIYLIILFISMCAIAQAQTRAYTIKSLEGDSMIIKLDYKLFSKKLTISCRSDTIYLDDYTGIIQIHKLSRNFLQIEYETRGGTGAEIYKTLIMSIVKSKINIAMLVTSHAKWISPVSDKPKLADVNHNFDTRFELAGDSPRNYHLSVTIREQQTSAVHPKTNYTHIAHVILNFNLINNVFYSSYKLSSSPLSPSNSNRQKEAHQNPSSKIPVIELGKYTYQFINDRWYESSYHPNIFSVYHR